MSLLLSIDLARIQPRRPHKMADSARIALVISTRVNAPADTLPTYRGFLLAMEDIAANRPAGAVPIE